MDSILLGMVDIMVTICWHVHCKSVPGRSIREFLVGTIVFPSVISIVWLTLFGDNAINQFLSEGNRNVIDTIQNQSPEMAIYKFLEGFPFSEITSLVAITLICIFYHIDGFGALVIDTIASNENEYPVQQRILWCLLIGLIAIALP